MSEQNGSSYSIKALRSQGRTLVWETSLGSNEPLQALYASNRRLYVLASNTLSSLNFESGVILGTASASGPLSAVGEVLFAGKKILDRQTLAVLGSANYPGVSQEEAIVGYIGDRVWTGAGFSSDPIEWNFRSPAQSALASIRMGVAGAPVGIDGNAVAVYDPVNLEAVTIIPFASNGLHWSGAFNNEILIIVSRSGQLAFLNRNSKAVNAATPLRFTASPNVAGAISRDGVVYIAYSDDQLERRLNAYSARTAQLLWTRIIDRGSAGLVMDGAGNLFAGIPGRVLYVRQQP